MYTRPISSGLLKKARDQLNEIPRRVPQDVRHMRKWLGLQPHLHARTDDQWLLNFLRICRFDYLQAKERLDLLYTMRSLAPELFTNRDPFLTEIQEVLSHGIILPLREAAGDAGPRIVLIRFQDMDSKVSFATVVKTALMIVDLLLYEDDHAVIAGPQLFVDLHGVTLECFLNLDVNLFKIIKICLEKVYIPKPKNVHFVNVPVGFEMMYRFLEGFIAEKFRSLIYIHPEGTATIVSQTVPRYLVPREYGGNGDSLEDLTVYWKKKVGSYKDWFLDDEQYRSDESKRPGKPKTFAEVFNSA